MNVPSLPDIDVPLIDMERFERTKKAYMHPAWYAHISQLTSEAIRNLSNEGFVPPSQPASNIALLTQSQNGAILYNLDTESLVTNIAGTFKTIQTV